MIKNASKAGKSIVQTIRLSGGMNLITITRKIRICEKHTRLKSGDLFRIMQGWTLYMSMVVST